MTPDHNIIQDTANGVVPAGAMPDLLALGEAVAQIGESILADILAGHPDFGGWYCEPIHKSEVAEFKAALEAWKRATS
jgi:hypothetical protein